MSADTQELKTILTLERRYIIPALQLDYEWTEKGQFIQKTLARKQRFSDPAQECDGRGTRFHLLIGQLRRSKHSAIEQFLRHGAATDWVALQDSPAVVVQ